MHWASAYLGDSYQNMVLKSPTQRMGTTEIFFSFAFRIYNIQLIKSIVRKNDVIPQNAGECYYSCPSQTIMEKK